MDIHVYASLCRPRRVGVDITVKFTDVGLGVSVLVTITPITKGTPAQIFLGSMVLFPRVLAFHFCYDLDLCSKGQAMRAFLLERVFSNFVKSIKGILIKHVKNLIAYTV